MNTQPKTYRRLADGRAAKSPLFQDMLRAFCTGGILCTLAQLLQNAYMLCGLDTEKAGGAVSATLIAIAVFLTAIGVFDKIARFSGAGTLVPITGFANAAAAAAIDGRSEGFIMGIGANLFRIVGPVITYGVSAGCVYGLVYWICGFFW